MEFGELLVSEKSISGTFSESRGTLTLNWCSVKLGEALLTLGSGQSSSCSRPETKTEPAKEKF